MSEVTTKIPRSVSKSIVFNKQFRWTRCEEIIHTQNTVYKLTIYRVYIDIHLIVYMICLRYNHVIIIIIVVVFAWYTEKNYNYNFNHCSSIGECWALNNMFNSTFFLLQVQSGAYNYVRCILIVVSIYLRRMKGR